MSAAVKCIFDCKWPGNSLKLSPSCNLYSCNAVSVKFNIFSVFKSLQLRTVHGRRIFHTWEETEALITEKKIKVEPVISHRYPMSKFEDAFKALLSGQACKIVIDPQA